MSLSKASSRRQTVQIDFSDVLNGVIRSVIGKGKKSSQQRKLHSAQEKRSRYLRIEVPDSPLSDAFANDSLQDTNIRHNGHANDSSHAYSGAGRLPKDHLKDIAFLSEKPYVKRDKTFKLLQSILFLTDFILKLPEKRAGILADHVDEQVILRAKIIVNRPFCDPCLSCYLGRGRLLESLSGGNREGGVYDSLLRLGCWTSRTPSSF
jgi:hypothetical protein